MTFTKEQAELHAFITGFLSDPMHDDKSANSMTAEVFRIALAALTAEPVAYMYKDNLHADARFSLQTRFGNWSQEDINEYEITEIPLYTAPPAPVVPDERPSLNNGIVGFDEGWNACRAAMLQGAEPVSQPYTLPTKCWCYICRPVTMNDARFVVCPKCGNKRCPHANDHRNACTGSNEPGQEGSAYPASPQQEADNG